MTSVERTGVSLLLIACTLAYGGSVASSAAGWQDVAPLPEPRWIHVAACDLDRRVYAYAGYTASVPEARDYAIGGFVWPQKHTLRQRLAGDFIEAGLGATVEVLDTRPAK